MTVKHLKVSLSAEGNALLKAYKTEGKHVSVGDTQLFSESRRIHTLSHRASSPLGLRRRRGDGGACDGVRAGDLTGGGARGGLPSGEGCAVPDRAGGHVQGRAQVAFFPQAPALRPGPRLQGQPHHRLWYGSTSISQFLYYHFSCISASILAFNFCNDSRHKHLSSVPKLHIFTIANSFVNKHARLIDLQFCMLSNYLLKQNSVFCKNYRVYSISDLCIYIIWL